MIQIAGFITCLLLLFAGMWGSSLVGGAQRLDSSVAEAEKEKESAARARAQKRKSTKSPRGVSPPQQRTNNNTEATSKKRKKKQKAGCHLRAYRRHRLPAPFPHSTASFQLLV